MAGQVAPQFAIGDGATDARAILADPLLAFAAKVAEIALVLAVVAIARRRRPRVASLVSGVAILAGGVGAWSNVR